MHNEKGLIHLYIGDGKGKTTAAAGLALRACGTGEKVLFAQFLKGRPSGEIEPLRAAGVEVLRTDPVLKFITAMNKEEYMGCCQSCIDLFAAVCRALRSGEYGMVVLDEIMAVMSHGIISEKDVIHALNMRFQTVEAVLTGRNPPPGIYKMADYISEIRSVRHPYEKGITARKGVEY